MCAQVQRWLVALNVTLQSGVPLDEPHVLDAVNACQSETHVSVARQSEPLHP
jgi:hypothetical protein